MDERPSAYQLGAALIVARLIDHSGNTRRDAHDTYRQALTQGEYPAAQLEVGERLLLRAGLLKQCGDRVSPTPALPVVAAADDAMARQLLDARLHEATDDDGQALLVDEDRRSRVGAIGEDLVVAVCREELRSLGHPELGHGVQRVSLVSDALGFDVVAPAVVGPNRRLEVKTQSWRSGCAFRFFLSRNEFETGRRYVTSWALVACRLSDGADAADVLGWCRVDTLRPHLPEDHGGRWTEAVVNLPLGVLLPGVPPAV